MVTSTKSRLTGERPQQGVTPDSLLALHEAGYRAVLERIGQGRILDVGCGFGLFAAYFGPRCAVPRRRGVVVVRRVHHVRVNLAHQSEARHGGPGPDGGR